MHKNTVNDRRSHALFPLIQGVIEPHGVGIVYAQCHPLLVSSFNLSSQPAYSVFLRDYILNNRHPNIRII